MFSNRIGPSALLVALFLLVSCQGSNGQNSSDNSVKLIANEELTEDQAVAYLASGCFWCTEAQFERIEGVVDVSSGYAGGIKENPSYREVASGRTRYAEAVRVVYDPSVVSYKTLLDVFFVGHDPTTLNRQGPDKGPQYRSAIFYRSEEEKNAAEGKISAIDRSGKLKNKVVTEVTAYTNFIRAEEYHQDYYELNPRQPYILAVSKPKVEKVMKTFPELLKAKYRS